jgi:hypothetical protein
MANRFWVGGTGTWDALDTTHWAATSGGAGGQSVPTSSDAVAFDASSGGGTVTLGANGACSTLTLTGSTATFSNAGGYGITVSGSGSHLTVTSTYTLSHPITVTCDFSGAASRTATWSGSQPTEANCFSVVYTAGSGSVAHNAPVRDLTFSGSFTGTVTNQARNIYGSLTAKSGMTFTAGTSATTFAATSGTKTITSAGLTLDFPFTFNGVGGAWQLADALTLGTTRAVLLTNGTLNTNGQAVVSGNFSLGAGTKALTLGASTWTCHGNFNTSTNSAGFTLTVGTSTISMASTSGATFSGGANTWNVVNIAGAGPITIAQNNTYANFTNTVQPCTVRFNAGSVQTFTNFSLSGTAGNLVTLDTTSAGSAATLSKASGSVSPSYLSIKDSAATGGASWRAAPGLGNINVSGNSGWIFANKVSGGGVGLQNSIGLGL